MYIICTLNISQGLFYGFFGYLPSLPSSPLPLEVGPLKYSYGVWGSAVNSPSGVWRSALAEFWILVHFSLKIWHLVATVLMIFLRIN